MRSALHCYHKRMYTVFLPSIHVQALGSLATENDAIDLLSCTFCGFLLRATPSINLYLHVFNPFTYFLPVQAMHLLWN